MKVETFVVGEIKTNCYVVSDEETGICVVIDPGDEGDLILSHLRKNNLQCKYVLLTHGHRDHYGDALRVSDATGAVIFINKKDTGDVRISKYGNFEPDERTEFYSEGDEIHAGNLIFRVIDTPGHTPGGVSLICGDALFTGDTLFHKSCGKVRGGVAMYRTELKSLKKLSDLPGDYKVYPGHLASTTLDYERNFNTFVIEANDTVF